MNKFFTVFVAVLVLSLAFSACSSTPFVAQNISTETPTRRAVRPTFTPKPRATATEEIPPTEEPTETEQVIPTLEQPTEIPATAAPTKKPAVQKPQPTKPPQPTEPPKPRFSMNVTSQFLCPQDNIYEIAVSVKKDRIPIEGIYFAAFDQGGRLLQDGAGKELVTATYPVSVSTAGNCRLSGSFENPVMNNGKLDVGDAVRQLGTSKVIMRFVKSAADLTPISVDIPIDFGTGGRYWVYTQSQ